ncbi:hypothetical protein LCGC14_2399520 [marine sediment metagenome]|uniref:Uncharacterized protein n=1 Tax=marine sediment metagenome TaxID=412755 RepID=A0A0F9EQ59_9ZZZZ
MTPEQISEKYSLETIQKGIAILKGQNETKDDSGLSKKEGGG